MNTDDFASDPKIYAFVKKYEIQFIPFFAKLDGGMLNIFTKEETFKISKYFRKK